MKKILISAGHSNMPGRDRGAAGNGFIEGDLAVEFRNLLYKELEILNVNVYKDIDNSILAESISDFKLKTSSDSILIDIHWNAGPVTATGTEVLIPDSPSTIEKNLAKDVADIISETLGIQLRGNFKGLKGVKSEADSQHKKLGFMRLNGETILIEMCFISNKSDMEKYQSNKKVLAKRLANIICEYSCVISNEIVSAPSKTHKVVKGDSLSKIASLYQTSVTNIKTLNNLKTDVIVIGQVLKIK